MGPRRHKLTRPGEGTVSTPNELPGRWSTEEKIELVLRFLTDRIGLLARPIVQTTKCRDVAGWFSPTGWPSANVTKSGLRWAFPTVLYLRWLAKPVTCRPGTSDREFSKLDGVQNL